MRLYFESIDRRSFHDRIPSKSMTGGYLTLYFPMNTSNALVASAFVCFVQITIRFRLNVIGQRVEHVGRLVPPSALPACL